MIELIIGAGQMRSVQADLDAAARDGARSATQAQSPGRVHARLQEIADVALAEESAICAAPVAKYGASNKIEPGGTVHVEVTCQATLGLLGGTLFGGPVTLTGSAVEPLSPYRSYD